MQLTLLSIAALPLLALLGCAAVAGGRVVRALRRGQMPPVSSVAALLGGLLVVDGAASIAVVVNGALRHSEAAKRAATWTCVGLSLVLVVVPVVALLIATRKLRSGPSVRRG
jgi:uncharacterized membrane protein YidH (DUF202 family)